MHEQEIRLTTACATAMWVIGVGLVIGGLVTNRNGLPGLGVMCAMAATLCQIRGYFAAHDRCIRQAFDLGRDHERGKKADVRQLRS